jgi:TPR repeat protein
MRWIIKLIFNNQMEDLFAQILKYIDAKDYDSYFMEMIDLADKGYIPAQKELDRDYHNSTYMLQDHQKTFKYYECHQDGLYACRYLAFIYKNGNMVEKNIPKSIELYLKCIDIGDTRSMNDLANIYLTADVKYQTRKYGWSIKRR